MVWLGFVIGAVVGSYLATVLVRWPLGESAQRGRSRCDACLQPVSALALVPIISFLVLRGRCRCCGAAIAPVHPVMEVLAGLVGAVAVLLFPDQPLEIAAAAALGWLLLLLAALDLRHLWLPDPLVLLLATSGIAWQAAQGQAGLVDGLAGMALGFGALEAIRRGYRALRGRDGMGAGDPKLLGAIGVWTGWAALPWIVAGAACVGLLAVAGWALLRGGVAQDRQLPLGTLLALAAWPIWLIANMA